MPGASTSGELEVSKFPGGTDCEVVGRSQGMFRCSPSISVCIGFLSSYEIDIGPGGPSSGATCVSQVEDPSCCCTEVTEAQAQMDPR
jgi:hypothetical protein